MTFFTAKNIGCFRDTGRRAISPLEGRSRLLKGSYRRRKYAIRKCALAAQKRGFRVFAVQHGGWCAASRTGHLTYRRYGRSNRCRNGKGGPWANDVYVLRGIRFTYVAPEDFSGFSISYGYLINKLFPSFRELRFLNETNCETFPEYTSFISVKM